LVIIATAVMASVTATVIAVIVLVPTVNKKVLAMKPIHPFAGGVMYSPFLFLIFLIKFIFNQS